MKTNDESLQFWEERIKERIQKGMTIREWCEKNNLRRHHYYYWSGRVRELQKRDEETIFSEIEPLIEDKENKREKKEPSSAFQIFFNGIQVTVPEDFNSEALAGLMKILQKI